MNKPRLLSKDLLIIACAHFFVALNFYLLMVFISTYAMERFQASPSQAGLASSIFVIGGLITRLLTGKWIERIGRARTLITGLASSLVMTLLYFAAHGIGFLWVVRFLHGAAFGIGSTASATIVANIVPKERRGEGLAYFMLSVTLATAIGPFLAVFVSQHSSFNTVFLICTTSASLSLGIALFLSVPELVLTNQQLDGLKGLSPGSFFEPRALPIAIVCGAIYFCYSAVVAFLGAYAKEAHLLDSAGFFFVVYAAVVLLSRPCAGRLFDLRGENTIMYVGILIFVCGMILLGQAHHGYALLLSAAFIGLGTGSIWSVGQAVSVKVALPHRIGLGTSTFLILVDGGMGIGPLVFGLFVPFAGYRAVYIIGGIIALGCTFLYYMLHGKKAAFSRIARVS